MPLSIEDYALIGNRHTASLVGRDGSIDWLCVPRFDDAACFCALLGTPENGRWLLAPAGAIRRTSRRYRARTLILETEFETSTGAVRIVDFMPILRDRTEIVRIVDGMRGRVQMQMELVLRKPESIGATKRSHCRKSATSELPFVGSGCGGQSGG